MLNRLDPAVLHGGPFLLASVLALGVVWWFLGPNISEVARATHDAPQGRCAEVVWLPLVDGCRGIVLLQLAGSQGPAEAVVRTIRERNVAEAALSSVKIDFALIPTYVACLGLFGAIVAGLQMVRSIPVLRWVVLFVAFLQGVAGVLDGFENVGLFAMLRGSVEAGVPEWTFQAAVAKWWLVTAGVVVPVLACAVALLARRGAGSPAGTTLAPGGP